MISSVRCMKIVYFREANCLKEIFFRKNVMPVTLARLCSSATKTEELPVSSDSSESSEKPLQSSVKLKQVTKVSVVDSSVTSTEMRNPFWNIEKDFQETESSDVPHFIDDIKPSSPISFNLAAYVNKSPTLKKLVELGVDLSIINEKAEKAKFIMRLDFENDMKSHIQFLHDNGVEAKELGVFITKNPLIFKEHLEDLQVRVNYLQSKKFSESAIARIISRFPNFLSMDTKSVDRRLGYLQKTFSLSGDEVRFLLTKFPKIVGFDQKKFLVKLFVLKEELGFTASEMKQLLLMKPKLYFVGAKNLKARFNVAHNMMGLSHADILKYPGLLLKREFLLEQRHKYLVHLGRAQYDPTKPGYVSIIDIATTTDNAFCKKCAKTSVAAYNEFLKTL